MSYKILASVKFLAIGMLFFSTASNAAPATTLNNVGFMTQQDLMQNADSGVQITSTSGSTLNLTGIYVSDMQINNNSQDCSATDLPVGNTQLLASFTPVSLAAHQTATIGQTYLFNLIHNAAMYEDVALSNNDDASKVNCITLEVTTTAPGTTGTDTLNSVGNTSSLVLSCSLSGLTCTAVSPTTINVS